MSDQIIAVPYSGTSPTMNVDVSELTVNGKTVERQRMVVADDSDPNGKAKVLSSNPTGSEYGLVVRTIPAFPKYFQITAAMGTTAQVVKNGAGAICCLINTDNSQQAVNINIYDSTSTTPAASTLIYSAQLNPSQVITLNFETLTGIVIQCAGAVSPLGALLTYF